MVGLEPRVNDVNNTPNTHTHPLHSFTLTAGKHVVSGCPFKFNHLAQNFDGLEMYSILRIYSYVQNVQSRSKNIYS